MSPSRSRPIPAATVATIQRDENDDDGGGQNQRAYPVRNAGKIAENDFAAVFNREGLAQRQLGALGITAAPNNPPISVNSASR